MRAPRGYRRCDPSIRDTAFSPLFIHRSIHQLIYLSINYFHSFMCYCLPKSRFRSKLSYHSVFVCVWVGLYVTVYLRNHWKYFPEFVFMNRKKKENLSHTPIFDNFFIFIFLNLINAFWQTFIFYFNQQIGKHIDLCNLLPRNLQHRKHIKKVLLSTKCWCYSELCWSQIQEHNSWATCKPKYYPSRNIMYTSGRPN